MDNAEDLAHINDLDPDIIKQMINQNIALFFVSCGIAWRRVENVYFKRLVKLLLSIDPNKVDNYTCLTRQTLSTTALRATHSMFDKHKTKLLQNTESILMADGWKNKLLIKSI